jgi:hypothetical protein
MLIQTLPLLLRALEHRRLPLRLCLCLRRSLQLPLLHLPRPKLRLRLSVKRKPFLVLVRVDPKRPREVLHLDLLRGRQLVRLVRLDAPPRRRRIRALTVAPVQLLHQLLAQRSDLLLDLAFVHALVLQLQLQLQAAHLDLAPALVVEDRLVGLSVLYRRVVVELDRPCVALSEVRQVPDNIAIRSYTRVQSNLHTQKINAERDAHLNHGA